MTLTETEMDEHARRIDQVGYTVVEDAIDLDLVTDLCEDLMRLERETGALPALNSFEGDHTIRIYNLLARGRLYEQIPVHESVLPVVERVLDRGCLVSSLSSISILAAETEQPIHADDQLIPLTKPHVPIVCNSMWALTDFTEENGATRLVPGSHRADHNPEYGKHYESVPALIGQGCVLVWNGSLWHGGGANHTDHRRVGIAMNYCAGYIRQQENQQLGIALSTAQRFSPRLQALCGFGIYNGLVGHIDKREPADVVLRAQTDARGVIWDGV